MSNIKEVLLIDDDMSDQIIAKEAISGFDSSIVLLSAFDGEEALTLLSTTSSPDLILLDINIPGMNGHEFLEECFKREWFSTAVVMLTTSDQQRDKDRALQYDFVKDYITMPLETSLFGELVETLV